MESGYTAGPVHLSPTRESVVSVAVNAEPGAELMATATGVVSWVGLSGVDTVTCHLYLGVNLVSPASTSVRVDPDTLGRRQWRSPGHGPYPFPSCRPLGSRSNAAICTLVMRRRLRASCSMFGVAPRPALQLARDNQSERRTTPKTPERRASALTTKIRPRVPCPAVNRSGPQRVTYCASGQGLDQGDKALRRSKRLR